MSFLDLKSLEFMALSWLEVALNLEIALFLPFPLTDIEFVSFIVFINSVESTMWFLVTKSPDWKISWLKFKEFLVKYEALLSSINLLMSLFYESSFLLSLWYFTASSFSIMLLNLAWFFSNCLMIFFYLRFLAKT